MTSLAPIFNAFSSERLKALIRMGGGNRRSKPASFPGSAAYWEHRYAVGGNSGAGSYGHLAEFKANIINDFVRAYRVRSAIELGSGDGNQLSLLEIDKYIGIDCSATAVKALSLRFSTDPTKQFYLDRDVPSGITAELSLSLDVIYHLIEDSVFHGYLDRLFSLAEKYVIIYSSNSDWADTAPHVRHRRFTDFIEKEIRQWELSAVVENPHKPETLCDFFIYKRSTKESKAL